MGRVTIFVTPLGWADGHGPDAGQWPGSYGQCAASPWAALAERVRSTWSQLRAVRRTARRPTSGPGRRQRGRMHGRSRTAPGRRSASPWAALVERVGWHLVPAPGSQQDGQTGRQWVTRGPQAGRLAGAGRLQGGALCLPGAALAERVGTWSRLRTVRRPVRRPTAGPGRGPQAGCLAEAGQLQRGALFLPGRPWPGGYAGTWSRLQAVRRTASRATGGPGRGPRAGRWAGAGRLRRGALRLPGRPWPSGWAGTWSRLRAVRRTTRRADSGPRAGCRAMAEQRAMLP